MPNSSKKWIAYLDILGFKKLIEEHPADYILSIYSEALQEAEFASSSPQSAIKTVHFSDTFIFYSGDDSGGSYSWIQSVCKNMARGCVYKRIPFRAALTVGEFYADSDKDIYFGKALNEAYHEAESQDWIGLIMTPGAEQRVSEYNLLPSRHQFQKTIVPTKNGEILRLAYDFHEYVNQGQIISSLQDMMKLAPDEAKKKYQNTLKFLQAKFTNTEREIIAASERKP